MTTTYQEDNMPATLNPFPQPTSKFTFLKKQGLFVGELSDVRLERVYPDACDVGFTLVSTRTGRRVVMVVEQEHHNADGELTYLELRPANHADRGIARVHLYND